MTIMTFAIELFFMVRMNKNGKTNKQTKNHLYTFRARGIAVVH